MSGLIRNIWDAANQEVMLTEKDGLKGAEKSCLFVGGKSSGKTTVMLKFLSREDSAKPTTALEYTFARRATNLQHKLTGHIWELGGGTNLRKLVDIPLTLDTLQRMTVLLFLDLSEPNKLWFTAETLLRAMRERLDVVLKTGNKQNPGFQQLMNKAAWERIGGKDRNDANSINPFPVPLFIIGSKFDLYQDMDSDKKKVITKCMRFLAHSNGATAMYVSSKVDTTMRGFKHIMNVSVFDGQLNKSPIIDSARPLYIPCGMDSMDAIGKAPLASSDIGRITSKNPSETWKIAFCGHFPQDGDVKQADIPDPAKDAQFREPKIDELRAQKDKELEAYKRQESHKWTDRIA
ncbi:cytoplasmic dynein 2 light intermediate chain 1-like [Clavelina lepadiformis]|uniref:cytoplasmic dynein 2 light intermediate chain 1-like n=1 Tax=Clavelina lepadiformis TaxID=159417 RepID=UPI0040431330